MGDGGRRYKLKLPPELKGQAENLVALWDEEVKLSKNLVNARPEGDKLQVNMGLPKEAKPNTDWKWYTLSMHPSEKILRLLKKGEIDLEKPRFHTIREDGRKQYYLSFLLTHQGESIKEATKGTSLWSRVPKASIAVLSVIFCVALIYSTYGIPFEIVASDSMEPVFSRGDIVVTTSPPEEIESGDIVEVSVPKVFRQKYGYPEKIMHRVVEVSGKYVVTKGDATGEDPFKSEKSNITGLYTGFKLPLLGHLFLFFQTMWGMIYLSILVGGLMLYYTIPPWLEKRRKRENRISRAFQSSIRTRDSLVAFSSAMNQYAKHLKSHTSAVQNLAKTSQHLDKVVSDLEENLDESPS